MVQQSRRGSYFHQHGFIGTGGNKVAEYEKDFVLRQTQMLAKGLGAFLKKDSIDEILSIKKEEQKNDIEEKKTTK